MKPDFMHAFNALPGAFMILDRELRYVAASDGYCNVTMRAREELIGRNIFDLFPNAGESGARLKASFEKVLSSGKPDTLAYIPYDIPRPPEQGGGMETRFWSAVHSPIPDREGRAQYVIQNTTDVTELVRLREASTLPFRVVPAERDLVARAQEAEEAQRQTNAESEKFKRLFQQAPGFFAVMSGPRHVFTFANDSYVRLIGGRQVLGQAIAEALPEMVEQGFVDLLDEVFRTGESYSATGTRIMLETERGHLEEFYLDFSYQPIRDPEGNITGIFVQGMDMTAAAQAQSRQILLINELNHRVKNTLSSVRTIASQTFKVGRDTQVARNIFDSRIQALARTHDMLVEREWSNADFREMLKSEFAPYGLHRYRLSGKSVIVDTKTSIALTLAIHELVTNAAKYGALSGETGVVSISWKQTEEGGCPWLLIEWDETGGPCVVAPHAAGFGTRLIQTVVRGELAGRFASDFAQSGFTARILVPLKQGDNS